MLKTKVIYKQLLFFWASCSIILGAFGAHALKPQFSEYQIKIWETANLYHLFAAVMLLLFYFNGFKKSVLCLFAGSLIFSLSLYALAYFNLKILGAITPLGGCLLAISFFFAYKESSTS
jgi:uncharacterized membrane protein YgdD (TMEM256/DUF423 family)